MTPYLDDGDVRLYLGDCVEVMAGMGAESVDAVVTDPPYALTGASRNGSIRSNLGPEGNPYAGNYQRGGFMGQAWDGALPGVETWREALRVLRPGGHLLAFGGTRTFHRLTCAIEDAGFEVRDCLSWLYGSGFPKSLNLDGDWQGWGTALKPAWEPIVLARKPLAGTVAGNVLAHGTGAINVDGCRIGTSDDVPSVRAVRQTDYPGSYTGDGPGWGRSRGGHAGDEVNWSPTAAGRWPANVVLSHTPDCREVGVRKVRGHTGYPNGPGGKSYQYSSDKRGDEVRPNAWPGYADPDGTETVPAFDCSPDCPVRMLDEQAGERDSHGVSFARAPKANSDRYGAYGLVEGERGYTDLGGPSRFFATFPTEEKDHDQHRAGTSSSLRADDPLVLHRPTVVASDQPEAAIRRGHDGRRDLMAAAEGTSRFFYTSKASTAERDGATHPTVKPLALMRWLVRLVTPPGGLVLDPFAGSGTTGLACREEGFRAVLIEREEEYAEMAAHRLRQLSLFGELA